MVEMVIIPFYFDAVDNGDDNTYFINRNCNIYC